MVVHSNNSIFYDGTIEGDVNLLETKDSYDIHVVAGVLKMWLRELPTSVLTREHRMDFLHVIGNRINPCSFISFTKSIYRLIRS
jgi:hypothetical protein